MVSKQHFALSPQPIVRLEKRAGKKVTVITGLHTYGIGKLAEIARTLKTSCGAGGTVKNGVIEIQGDKIMQVQAYFKSLDKE
ncbi:MAG: translation initiation factor [Endomicrobiales bacterium]|jgi:translation initiation factor 1